MGSTPKRDTLLRAEWTLMSTNSVFDSFERNDTTSNQQNCQNYANNVNNVNNVNNSNINLALTGKCNQSKLSDCSKSKSYIHAMQSLQKHSKVLET